MNLVLQILEITDRAVLCLNLIDEAERNKIEIDQRSLSRSLGIPVVPTSARFNLGINDLIQTIYEVAMGTIVCRPHRIENVPPKIKLAVDQLSQEIKKQYPNLPNARWLAFRLLEGDQHIINALQKGEFV
jgi:ferrous iron transport protein B